MSVEDIVITVRYPLYLLRANLESPWDTVKLLRYAKALCFGKGITFTSSQCSKLIIGDGVQGSEGQRSRFADNARWKMCDKWNSQYYDC